MEAKFTAFFALCAVAVVCADSDIQSQVIRWANEQLDWLHADGIEFPQWVAAEIDNPDLSERIKTLLNNFVKWAVPVITELKEKFTAIKELSANPSAEELQQLRKGIPELQHKVAYAVEIVIERSDDIYTDIVDELNKSISEANKEALVAVDKHLHNKTQVDKEWRDTANGEGDIILSQIPVEE